MRLITGFEEDDMGGPEASIPGDDFQLILCSNKWLSGIFNWSVICCLNQCFSHIGSLFTCDLGILLLYFGLQAACKGTSSIENEVGIWCGIMIS